MKKKRKKEKTPIYISVCLYIICIHIYIYNIYIIYIIYIIYNIYIYTERYTLR